MPYAVLVVDDSVSVRRVLSTLVEMDERLVLVGTAEDGAAALRAVAAWCPDAIVLDAWMPKMDGLEALPLLREACAGTVIVMFSSDSRVRLLAAELGADDVMEKNRDPAELLERLVELCRQRHREDA